jgi:tetratricopeptide (TPR) repeat protein
LALLGLVAAAYSPGLSGPFLLDDWSALPKLGAYGPVDNPVTFVSYITSGIAGPTGRPLALASFLIDAHSWPAAPGPFKLTNVLLHLLNGALLALLLHQLSEALGLMRRRALWIGILGAGLWLAHPLLVSTTLYIVQRMAILAALFVLAGLNLYVWGRMRLRAGHSRSAYTLMVAGIVGGTFFGFFSKENAALLPLLALVLEWTVLKQAGFAINRGGGRRSYNNRGISTPARSPATASRTYAGLQGSVIPDAQSAGKPPLTPPSAKTRKGEHYSSLPFTREARKGEREGVSGRRPHIAFRAIFLWLPALAICAYLLWECRHLTAPLPYRNFTILERVLTEARVVVHYLYLLVIPHGGTHGLYTHVAVSQGLLQPWTTLPAILIIVAIVGFAFAVRRRLPVLAAAILFYFAGQLLESTTIPLELYYEHRNYLPAVLLFWPLAWWILRGPGSRALRAGIGAAALALVLALTAYRADLWGNARQLALTWTRLNHDSARAIVWGSEGLTATGRPELALKKLRLAVKRNPGDISIALSALDQACELHRARPSDLAAAAYAAGHGRAGSTLIYKGVARLARRMKATPCPPLNTAALIAIPRAATANPHFTPYPALKQEFLVLEGRLLLREHKKKAAYHAFAKALPLNVKPDVALIAAAHMDVAHAPRLGLKLLDEYRRLPKPHPHGWSMKRVHRWWLDRIGWYSNSFKRVRAALEKQLRAKK